MDITLQDLAVPSYITVALVIFLGVSSGASTLYLTLLSPLLDRKQRQTDRLKELAGDQTLSPSMQLALQEEREKLLFKHQYGISTHREMRHALIHLNRECPDKATWNRLRRAYDSNYIELVHERLSVNMNGPGGARKGSTWVLAAVSALWGLTAIALGAFVLKNRPIPQLVYPGEFLLGLTWLWYCEVWRWPRQSAELIASCLGKEGLTSSTTAS